MRYLWLMLVLAVLCATAVMSHDDVTDRKGCHYDPETGAYHCH